MLSIDVLGARPSPCGATPTLDLELRLQHRGDAEVRSALLRFDVQIPTAARAYTAEERARLLELFGEEPRWHQTERPVLWAQIERSVPGFSGSCSLTLALPCSYDLRLTSAKYLWGLQDGEIPLALRFGGTLFCERDGRLGVVPLPWSETRPYRLPVALLRAALDAHYPDQMGMLVSRGLFDRLQRYRIDRGLLSCEQALERLLEAAQ